MTDQRDEKIELLSQELVKRDKATAAAEKKLAKVREIVETTRCICFDTYGWTCTRCSLLAALSWSIFYCSSVWGELLICQVA